MSGSEREQTLGEVLIRVKRKKNQVVVLDLDEIVAQCTRAVGRLLTGDEQRVILYSSGLVARAFGELREPKRKVNPNGNIVQLQKGRGRGPGEHDGGGRDGTPSEAGGNGAGD